MTTGNATGSAFVRRQLGKRLERLREHAHKKTTEVHAAKIIDRSHLWKIETGKNLPKPYLVEALCRFYGADEATTLALAELAKAGKGSGWFERYGDAVPKALGIYLGAELAANEINTYDPEVIHGVLQTEAYTRALFIGERPDSEPDAIDRLVQARGERQDMFWTRRPDDAMIRVVLNESALARRVGGRATMERQLDHLSLLDEREGVEIRVLPWDAGAHPGIYGGYAILAFPDRQDPTVTYLETYAGGTYFDDEADVERMVGVHTGILKKSITLKEYRDG